LNATASRGTLKKPRKGTKVVKEKSVVNKEVDDWQEKEEDVFKDETRRYVA
jgi:hypothetical protein